MAEPLLVERPADGVVLLTLALPDRRNAMTPELTGAWVRALDEIIEDRSVRALVVTGAGKAFCAGGDLSWIESGGPDSEAVRARMGRFYRQWLKIRDVAVPTIAALNGPAVGAGLCVALACDLRYAAPSARLSVPFTHLGMHPGMGATVLLPALVGVARARELLFTGRAVSGAEAVAMGLVNAVVPADELVATAVETATRIAAAAPTATRLTKETLRRSEDGLEAALEWEALAQSVTMTGGDAAEGIAARVAGRDPVFAPAAEVPVP